MSRNTDILIVEKVFHLPTEELREGTNCPYCDAIMYFVGARSWCTNCHEWRYSPYKEYSEEDESALEVLHFLGHDPKARWYIETNAYKDGMMYWVMYDPNVDGEEFDYIYESTSLAEAICKVALMYAEKHEH